MCRNIRPLFNFDPPVTDAEVHAASLQFVPKLSGFTKPSRANKEALDAAADDAGVDLVVPQVVQLQHVDDAEGHLAPEDLAGADIGQPDLAGGVEPRPG